MPWLSIRVSSRMIPGLLLAVAIAWLVPWGKAAAPALDPEHDWQVILEQAGGPGTRFRTQAEAATAARQHIDRQETALRNFCRDFPADPHRYSARIRLAGVLTAKSRLLSQPGLRAEAQTILNDLESDSTVPGAVKADAAFARLSQTMQDFAGRSDEEARETLLRAVRQFETDHPGDRRDPGLLAEVATLYDSQPAQKKALLEEASTRTSDEAVRKRIHDDLKRLSLLGRPVNARLQPWQGGAPVDLANRRGRATVVLFWATWSAPALRELANLGEVAKQFAGQPVDFLTVSLDEDRAALANAVKMIGLPWPVHCDGKGWEGQLVRALGINALPTVWVLDTKGNLLTLNARGQEAELIRRALE
jgi:thiol-disulfide isomerase/thioredoxin